MILDLSQLPAEVTFKNVNEITKMRLLSFIDNYVEKDDTITITVYSSEELAVLNRRLKDLDLEINDAEDSGFIPEKLFAGNTITVKMKNIINSPLLTQYNQDVGNIVDHIEEYAAYTMEHEQIGDIDDPEVQAKIAQYQQRYEEDYSNLQHKYLYSIEGNNDYQIQILGQEFCPVAVIDYEQNVVYSYYDLVSVSNFKRALTALYPTEPLEIDISKVTKAGWYVISEDEIEGTVTMKFNPVEILKEFTLSNINLNIHDMEAASISKDILSMAIRDISGDNICHYNDLSIKGLSEYDNNYIITIRGKSFSNRVLGDGLIEFHELIGVDYIGDIIINLERNQDTIYTTTIQTDVFVDNYYELDLKGHKDD